MTREAWVAYKSIKYELCNLKAECTNLAKEFTTVVFLDVNRWINLSSGEIHEAWVEFINVSVQFIPQVIIYRTDTYEMDFILDTVA